MEVTQRIKARLKEVQDWNAIVDEVETDAGQLEAVEQSSALFDLARTCERILLDKARAMQCYQKAFKLDQSNLLALQHAREIYQEMAHLEMVTRLMGLELKNNQDPTRAAGLNYAYGTAMLNLRKVDTAKSFLQAAAEAEPSNAMYQARSQETAYDRSDWQSAFDLLVSEINTATGGDDPATAEVSHLGAALSGLYLKAARILHQEAPEDSRLLPMLFKALDADPSNGEAGFVAETLLAAGENFDHIQALHERRVALTEEPSETLTLLIGFANTWQVRWQKSQIAALFFRGALDIAYAGEVAGPFPWHLAAYKAVKENAEENKQTEGLVDLARTGIAAMDGVDEVGALALQAAELAWRTENDIVVARELFVLTEKWAPAHPLVTEFVEAHGPLDQAREPSAEDVAKLRAKEEAAVEKAAAEKAEAAREAARKSEAEAQAAKEAAAEQAEAEAAAKQAADAARVALAEQLADESFSDDEMALIQKAQSLESKGGKRQLDAWRDAVSKMPSKIFPRRRLKELYVANNKWSNVADLYKEEIKYAEDGPAKIALYWEVLDLYKQRLKQPGLVVTTLANLEKLVEATGDNSALLTVVEAQQQQFETMKRWPDLIGRIRRRAELQEDSSAKTELYLEAGNLFLEKFNNQAEAIKSFEAVLEHEELNLEAIGKLKELYQRRRYWEKMVAVQRKELSLIDDPEEKQRQLLEVARTAAKKIKKTAVVIELWLAVLEDDPTNLEALEHLEHVQEREKDWAALAETLQTLTSVLDDDTKKSQYLVKLGLLFSDKVHDNAAAIRTWEELHSIDANNRRAQDALKKLYLAEGDMDSLQDFYAKQDKWAELIRVLERESDGAQGETWTPLMLKISELYKTRLDNSARAIRALEKALIKDDNNLPLAEALIELYQAANDERQIAGPLGIKLAHTEDAGEQQALLVRLADLAERIANDMKLAFDYFERAFAVDHTDTDVADQLRRLAQATGLWAELVTSFEAAIAKYEQDSAGLAIRATLADVYETHLNDLEKALASNQAIIDIDPEEATALASLERLYLALGREEDLLRVLDTNLSLTKTDDDRRRIQTRIGSIHEQLGHHEEAVSAYKSVLDMGVEPAVVLVALDRMYLGLEQWPELADVIRRQLELGSEDEATTVDESARLVLTHRLGVLQHDKLNEPSDAVELFAQVLESDPDHEDATARLQSWLEDDQLRLRAATILVPVLERRENWEQLVVCLEIQAAAGDEGPARLQTLLRVGTIFGGAIGDASRAFDVYSRAFREDPEDRTAAGALENIATIEQRWGDFAGLYEEAVAKDLPSELMLPLLGKLAEVYDTQLGDTSKAVGSYRRALDLDPMNARALDALQALYQRNEAWSDLLDIFRRKVNLEEDESERQSLRLQIAHLQVEMLAQHDEAVVTYNEILADDETNMPAIVALDRLYQAHENWSELAEVLDRQLALSTDEADQVPLSLRLGEVRLNRLNQTENAVNIYRRVLELDAHNSKAMDALEGLLDNEDHQLSVAKIVEPIYRQTNAWTKLIRSYEIMVARSLDPNERIRLLQEIGQLYEIAGEKPEQAFAAMGRALKEDPANEDTQRRLDTLATQMGSLPELVVLYEDAIKDVVDDQLSIRVLDKIAKIYATTLTEPDKAAASYERILELDPANFSAIDSLIEVHRTTNSFDALVQAVARKADMVDEPADRKQLLLYAANVRETVMESPEGAIELYQQVLALDDADAQALNALEKLYLGLENWESLKDVYSRKTELAEGDEERCAALRVLGQVYDRELSDVDRAIDTYQGILDIQPGDYEAIQALDRLFGQAQRWLDQLQVLEGAIEVVSEIEAKTELRFRIGVLWETELGDVVRSVEAYREVLNHDPSHAATMAALNRIVHGDSEPMTAALVLEPFYLQLAEWDPLVDLYEVMARHTEDPIARIERLHQIAGIHEQHRQSFNMAFDAYARALEIDAHDETTVEQMQRLAEVTGDWEKFSGLLAKQADDMLDQVAKVSMLKRIARIQLEKLNDVDKAITRFSEVLESEPEDLEAIQSLDHIFTHLERWTDLVENLARQIRVTDEEAASVALQFRMGQIYHVNIGDLAHAIEAYKEILNIDPGHEKSLTALELIFAEGDHQNEIAEILEPIYYSAERWEALVKLGDARLAALDDQGARFTVIQNVAEICEHKLNDIGDAYIWWLRAYMDDPTSEQIHDEVDRLAEATQEFEYIVDVAEQILEEEDGVSPEIKLAVLNRSAQVLDTKLCDTERALVAYRQVLELDGEHAGALAALDRIYSQAGLNDDLAEVLRRRIRIEMSTDLLVELELRLAEVFESSLANVDQAIAAHNRVLENDPRNVRALESLESLYLSQHRWDELFSIYEKRVDVANTDEGMAACYQHMAKIAADCLDRSDDAVDLWNRVLDLRGEDSVALNALIELHERAERWDELVDVLERQVYVVEGAERVTAYQQLGRTYGERLGKDRAALDAWMNALEIDPHNVPTLQTLKGIYEQSQAWMELIDVLDRLTEVGIEVLGEAQMRDIYAQSGRIQGEYLMQTDEAIGAWRKLLEIQEGDMEALAALEHLFTTEARWSEAITVLERKSGHLQDEDSRVDVLMQVASMWEEKLEDKNQAIGAYMEILEINASHAPAADALESIYRGQEMWGELTEHLLACSDNFDGPGQEVLYLQQAARVFEENLEDPGSAFEVLQAAFNIDYANEETSRELERIATETDKWTELLNEYNGVVTQIENPRERCELWVKIGRWYGEHLDRPDYGIQSLHEALELNPESVNALRELANFHRRDSNASELAATLVRIVPLETEPEAQASILLDLAQVQETSLDLADAAIESYRRVLEINSESMDALDALARLHEQKEQWSELVTVLISRQAVMSDLDLILAVKKRIGAVQEGNLGDSAAAIETYKDIVATEPTDRDALQALERLYMSGGNVDDYLETLEVELDATADVDEQVAIYDKMAAALIEHAEDRERAAEVLEKIVMLDPQRDATYRQLEELYSSLERWTELVETYRSHVEANEDPKLKIDLLSALGETLEKQIEDVDRAIECYSEILGLDPDHFAAANTLSRLQETIEDWPSAVETMGRLVVLNTDPEARLNLLTRMGRVYFEKLEDQETAEMRLNEALTMEPGHVPAMAILAELYKARFDWLKAARILRQASECSNNNFEKTNFASEAGFIFLQELEDIEGAREQFAQAIAIDPEHIKVGTVLSGMYFEANQFAEADPIFDMLSRKSEQLELDDEELRDLYSRAARTARSLDDGDKALRQYQRAYEIDSTDHEVLVGMADLLYTKQDWEKAFKFYQTILVQHRDSQSDDDTVLVYYRLGSIKRQQGEVRKALNYLEKALEVQPFNRPTIEAVIDLQREASDWEGVIQAKRALCDTADMDEQFELLVEIGTMYRERLNNARKSADAYMSALDLRDGDFSLLHTLLDLHTSNKQWDDAIAIIDRILEIEKEPLRRSRYHYTAAVLLRDELKAHDEAIDRFNRVLDEDPTYLKAFQAVDTMVTESKDWKTLERAYRKMLKRLPKTGQEGLVLTLWANLGEIYRTRLGNFKSAAAAFEIAAKLDPGNSSRHVVLAELYEKLLDENPKEFVTQAVREHQILIAVEPFRTESYHALYKIYSKSGQTDKAFCVASVLAFLKKANAEQIALHQKYRPEGFVQARQRLSESVMRAHVFHPDQDRLLTAMLGMIAPALAAWRGRELPSTIKPDERVDISIDPSLFSQMAKYTKDVLNVQQPDVYQRPNDPGDMEIMNIKRDGQVHPTVVVFKNLLRGLKEQHLAFALGRKMMDLYPPHYAYVALERSPQNLKQAFMACMRICGMSVKDDTAALDEIARQITGRMSQGSIDQLRSLMNKFIEAGGSTDVKRWAAAVELTGYRVGLLLSGDLATAALMVSQEQTQLGSAMSPKDKIKELVLYSISEDYFEARRHIGLRIGS